MLCLMPEKTTKLKYKNISNFINQKLGDKSNK